MTEVVKHPTRTPLSDVLRQNNPGLDAMLRAAEASTPEQREANIARAKRERAEVRKDRGVAYGLSQAVAQAEDRMGWKPGYILHLAQPYCGCYDGHDGWEYCQHAVDLGLRPW